MGKNRSLLTSTHHILPRSKSGSNHPRNLVELKHNVHMALHTVFSNDTPIEQYARLTDINQTVFKDMFIREILDVLSMNPKDIYHESAYHDISRVQKKYYHLDFIDDDDNGDNQGHQ